MPEPQASNSPASSLSLRPTCLRTSSPPESDVTGNTRAAPVPPGDWARPVPMLILVPLARRLDHVHGCVAMLALFHFTIASTSSRAWSGVSYTSRWRLPRPRLTLMCHHRASRSSSISTTLVLCGWARKKSSLMRVCLRLCKMAPHARLDTVHRRPRPLAPAAAIPSRSASQVVPMSAAHTGKPCLIEFQGCGSTLTKSRPRQNPAPKALL